MKVSKALASTILLSSLTFAGTSMADDQLPKNCHRVKNLSYFSCLETQQNGAKIYCGDKTNSTKVVCDKIESKEDLAAKIEAKEESRIFKCLNSIATNKKAMGIIPIGKDTEKKFEIKDHSLRADQSKKEHVLVDARSRRVQKCKFNGESKVCSRATWSDLKKVLKENIALSKVDPFKPVKEKYKAKKEDLTENKKDFESKESFVNSMEELDGEGIKKHLDKLAATDSKKAMVEKKKWKKIFSKKLGLKESDFSKLDKLKAIKKDKIAKALKELKEDSKKKLTELPNDEKIDKELYKKKMEKVAESAKNGKKLCHDIGLEGLVTEIKKKSGSQSESTASRGAASQTK